jgi:hypothetical protein
MEKEMRDHDELPASIKDYLENSPFKARLLLYDVELILTQSFRSRISLARKKLSSPANSATNRKAHLLTFTSTQ